MHPLSKRRKALQLTFWQKRRKNSDVFLSFCLNSNQECGSRKEIWKKTSENIWRLCDKVLTFAPAFRKECNRRLTCWLRNRFAKNSFLFFFYLPFAKRDDEKKKKEKNFRNYLEYMLKSSYLCIRFLKRKAVLKRSDLWRIYINNTSSTRARLLHFWSNLGYKKKNRQVTYIYIGNLKTFNRPSVLNRARTGSNTD